MIASDLLGKTAEEIEFKYVTQCPGRCGLVHFELRTHRDGNPFRHLAYKPHKGIDPNRSGCPFKSQPLDPMQDVWLYQPGMKLAAGLIHGRR